MKIEVTQQPPYWHYIPVLRDTIAKTWHVDDVLNVVAPNLEIKQAQRVLWYAHHDHNAEIGINWDVLRETAESLYGEEACGEMFAEGGV